MPDTDVLHDSPEPEEVERFWELVRHRLRLNPVPGYLGTYSSEVMAPPAWAFGATPEQADELLTLVLAGTKTATASALWDYTETPDQMPKVGDLAILLDGRAHPRALIETMVVEVVPFDQVSAEHARLEGEGDRTLESWRTAHERFFTDHAEHDRGFSHDMPVVLEQFKLHYPDLP